MDIYIARQPIFDRKLAVYGYEILHRQGSENKFSGIDDDRATTEVIYNSFFVMGLDDITDGSLAFINFSKDLIDTDVPYMLPSQSIVIEVLERKEATQNTIEACRKLRDKGYTIALDDFVLEQGNDDLIEIADIIKVEYPAVTPATQRDLIKRYGSKIRFLAEKIETREDYELAIKMGYDYFQGYFFSKPTMMASKEIESINTNILSVLQELSEPDPELKVISDIIEMDMGLSYKLLRLVNSVYYGTRNRIKTIHQALVYIGINEIYQWFSLMMLKDMQNVENAEIIKLSLIRGKLMELMAMEFDYRDRMEFFFTGMFSFIDILLNKPMEKVLESLPFSDKVKRALMGEDNEHRSFLDSVIAIESADWDFIEDRYPLNEIGAQRFMELYLDSLKWAKRLNY
ncbi:MAG: EAL and HDOD domain-containing protein [Anaerovoracaceae bacterium]|jgi:c-di-GMP-related signal transduction protein